MPPRSGVKRPLASSPEPKQRNKRAKKSTKATPTAKAVDKPKFLDKPTHVLTFGEGDTGQLGLGERIMTRRYPGKVTSLDGKQVVQVYAGGMHTLCLTKSGTVYSFGCNDEGALGRDTSVEGSEFTPGNVILDEPMEQICAGDSYSAVLGKSGKIYVWGTYRDASGPLGLTKAGESEKFPILASSKENFVKIASGDNHLVALTENGDVYTVGTAEQGQLGRLGPMFCHRSTRRGAAPLLHLRPVLAYAKARQRIHFSDIWTGAFSTFAKQSENGHIYAWGLNNYNQLGFKDDKQDIVYLPRKVNKLTNIKEISGGQHHTIALTSDGNVISFGRHDYGRLGLPDVQDTALPTTIPSLNGLCSHISTGNLVSYIVDNEGHGYSFGFGTNLQLSVNTEDPEEDVWTPSKMVGSQLAGKKIESVCGGGQHTVLLVTSVEETTTSE